MTEQAKYINGLLSECWYDVTEKYDELLLEWYGDDISLFNSDDADLAEAVRGLTESLGYWRFNPNNTTSYERLRAQFEALLDLHLHLLDKYSCMLMNNETEAFHSLDCSHEYFVNTQIKGGCTVCSGEKENVIDAYFAA